MALALLGHCDLLTAQLVNQSEPSSFYKAIVSNGHAEARGERSFAETLRLMRQGQKTYTGLNFRLQVVRDLTVEAMREVCRNYDIDGFELDYFRSPRLFPSRSVETAGGELVNVMEQLEKGFVGPPPPANPKDV